jgi:hypothetical protein
MQSTEDGLELQVFDKAVASAFCQSINLIGQCLDSLAPLCGFNWSQQTRSITDEKFGVSARIARRLSECGGRCLAAFAFSP